MLKIPLMRKDGTLPSPQGDIRTLNATLRKLRMPRWLWRVSVISISLLAFLWVSRHVLTLGALIRYDRLDPLGPQVVSFMTRINPYLWWGVVVILAVIVLSVLRAWLKASVVREKQTLVSVMELQKVADSMSSEGVDVLQWVWDAEAGPVTVGDLLRARDELRSDRVRKLATARAQALILQKARVRQVQQDGSGLDVTE
jgi:magnesium-transporting ATPase (P-type)